MMHDFHMLTYRGLAGTAPTDAERKIEVDYALNEAMASGFNYT